MGKPERHDDMAMHGGINRSAMNRGWIPIQIRDLHIRQIAYQADRVDDCAVRRRDRRRFF